MCAFSRGFMSCDFGFLVCVSCLIVFCVVRGLYVLVWVWMGLSGFVWVCLGLYGFVWVCPGLSGFVWVFLGLSGFFWVCLGLPVLRVLWMRVHAATSMCLGGHPQTISGNFKGYSGCARSSGGTLDARTCSDQHVFGGTSTDHFRQL